VPRFQTALTNKLIPEVKGEESDKVLFPFSIDEWQQELKKSFDISFDYKTRIDNYDAPPFCDR
jgi:hypothetical protein